VGCGKWAIGKPAFRWPQAKRKAATLATRALGSFELESGPAQSPSLETMVTTQSLYHDF